jgi:hypothetical protein
MQTLTIDVSSPQTLKLLEHLEAMNLIRVVSRQTKPTGQKLSEKLYGSISDSEAEQMREELRQIRSEWNRAI